MLFVLDAETGAVRAKIDTGAGTVATPNGLSGPIAIDTNGDGIADVVYAGDLNGNMWKFDLSSSSAGAWKVAFGGSPLFTTGGQPITVRPDVTQFTQGGYLVAFGTGRYIDTSDDARHDAQTFYGIRDNGAAGGRAVEPGAADRRQQHRDGRRRQHLSPDARTRLVRRRSTRRLSGDNAISLATYTSRKKGWYINLPASGERVVSDANIRAGRVVFNTLIPNTDPCGFGGTGWVMEVDVMTGNRNDTPTFDTNNDKRYRAADLDLERDSRQRQRAPVSSIPAAAGFLRAPTQSGQPPFENKYVNASSGSVEKILEGAGAGTQGRKSWRQIQ